MNLDLHAYQKIETVDGIIYLGPSDTKRSIGFLLLLPKQQLPKHNRPIEEWLVQTEGSSIIILYNNEVVEKKVVLRRGDSLKIPANQFHQHTNPTNKASLTSWRFDGDITDIINKLRKQDVQSRK